MRYTDFGCSRCCDAEAVVGSSSESQNDRVDSYEENCTNSMHCHAKMASASGITEASVKGHVSTILMRLDVSDRTQAVVTALQRGLVHL
jgi:hypothetical protein